MASRACSPERESLIKRRKFDISEKVRDRCENSSFVNYCGVCDGSHDQCKGESEFNCDSGFTDVPHMRDSAEFIQSSDNHSYSGEDNSDDASSDNSNLSNISGMNWKPMAGSLNWIQKKMITGANPRDVLNQLSLTTDKDLSNIDDMSLWRILINMFSEPPRREKLSKVNTLEDVIGLLKSSKNIIVLTGAGVSVSCGIPDFRSRDGIYARLAVDFPNLPDPHSMFDINYFFKDPRPFYKFAREIYPGQFKPSPCHRFIKLLEKHNKLLRNYTQNIDTLEQIAGIKNVIECHGSFATASCTRCKTKVTADDIREDIFKQRIPFCKLCQFSDTMTTDDNLDDPSHSGITEKGIMKPDIVFFGEGLPEAFHNGMVEDKAKCDLLIVIGTSLKVRPVGLIPNSIPEDVPQILINREPLDHLDFDVELLGDSDVIINQICSMMGDDWKEVCWLPEPLQQTKKLLPSEAKWQPNSPNSINQPSTSKASETLDQSSDECSPFRRGLEICSMDSSYLSENNPTSNDNQIVPDNKNTDESCKERHMSIDSAGDSGIGDGSNSIDSSSINSRLLLEDTSRKQKATYKLKCIADLLPPQTYFLEPPSRYIFPGAEVCLDEWDNSDLEQSSSDDSGSESDEGENNSNMEFCSSSQVIRNICDDSMSSGSDYEAPPIKRIKRNYLS